MAGMQLRPYQQAAREAVEAEWDMGRKRTLLVLPTGTGKTIVFAAVAEDMARRGRRGLVLAHRGELLDQAADKIVRATGMSCAVEKAESSSLGALNMVTVGSVQSLMQDKRLERFDRDRFSWVVVDEAHHCLSDSYQKVLQYFRSADVLGVTATPDRGDRKNLGAYFDSLAYEYTMPQAIRDGYLCPIEAQTIPLSIDISAVRQSNGDYSAGELGTALDPYLEQIADEMLAAGCKDRRTVVFLPLIATSQKFAHLLRQRGFRAAEVNGQSADRAQVLADFDAGEYDVLCNSMLLTEGWDCPAVDCIVVLRPTRVRSLYAQMVGRGTRLSPETGKQSLLLLDFLWHTSNHELVHPAHLMAADEATARCMTRRIEEAGGPVDLEEAEKAAQGDVVREREEALAQKLAEQRRKKRRLVDPLQFEMSIADADLAGYVPQFAWEMAPVTAKQAEALEKNGIFAEGVECTGKASLLLDRLRKRREAGLATAKQIRCLERYGFQHVGTWDSADASSMITRIAALGWKHAPRGVDPATYVPEPRPSAAEEMSSGWWS